MSLIPVECSKVHYGIPRIPIFNFVFLTLRNPVPNVNNIFTYLLHLNTQGSSFRVDSLCP